MDRILANQDKISRLDNIQILRALAALSVVLAHSIHEANILAQQQKIGAWDFSILNLGFGVDIFFVISGFIMGFTGASDFGRKGASWRFLSRRLARIVPLYWLLTTALIIGSLFAPKLLNVPIGEWSHILFSYLFIPDARIAGEIRPVLALGWTLNYEMFFYCIFAVSLFLPRPKAIIFLSLFMGGLALIGLIIKPAQTQISYWTNPIILEFLFGFYISIAYLAGTRIDTFKSAIILSAGLLGYLQFGMESDNSSDIFRFAKSGLPAALLVSAVTLWRGGSFGANRLISWSLILGEASYSLYLVHPFVIRPFRAAWGHFIGTSISPNLLIIPACIASALVAILLFKIIEFPITKLFQNFRHDVMKSRTA